MRIAGRTSGGRGEWELAGTQGRIGLNDVVDRELIIELLPGIRVPTQARLPSGIWQSQGKPRLRLQQPAKHAYLILTAALLLPKPKRDWSATSGGRLNLSDNDYSVHSIKFDIVELDQNHFVISPTDLVLTNSDEDFWRVDYAQRLRLVLDLWALAHQAPTHRLSPFVNNHRRACRSGNAADIMAAATAIRGSIHGDGDPLQIYYHHFNAALTTGGGIHREGIEEAFAEADDRSPIEAAKDRLRKLREQAVRGSEGDRFRRQVRRAYSDTCLFTGYRLPSTELTSRAGVEAAHILPWADYDLNVPTNGICLNRLCHWAFDEGILRLTHEPAAGGYRLFIPDPMKELARQGQIDLSPFMPLEGMIPPTRLPANQALWPDPAYISQLNSTFPY